MKLKTRVFELCNGKYQNLVELAQAMGMSYNLTYRVKRVNVTSLEGLLLVQQKPFPNINLMTFSMS
jgi:hypothetical protein